MRSPRYRLPLLHHTQRAYLPVGALRTFHCLHYLAKHRKPVDLVFDDDPQGRFVHRAPTVDLRELVGPRRGNDTRAVRAAVAALQADPRIASIELSPERRSIAWSFTWDPDELLKSQPYLVLDIGVVASLATPLEIYLYELCRRLDGMRFPQEDLLVEDLARRHLQGPATWAAIKPTFLRAASRIARTLDVNIALQVAWSHDPSGPAVVRFRPAGSKSLWSPRNVYKGLPSTTQLHISKGGEIVRLTPQRIAQIVEAYEAKVAERTRR